MKRDNTLEARLKGELPGIFAWAVEGARRWYSEGLSKPEAVTSAVSAYRSDMDLLGQFLQEECVQGSNHLVSNEDLYTRYVRWTERLGEFTLSASVFGRRLAARGFQPHKMGGARGWFGLGLN